MYSTFGGSGERETLPPAGRYASDADPFTDEGTLWTTEVKPENGRYDLHTLEEMLTCRAKRTRQRRPAIALARSPAGPRPGQAVPRDNHAYGHRAS